MNERQKRLTATDNTPNKVAVFKKPLCMSYYKFRSSDNFFSHFIFYEEKREIEFSFKSSTFNIKSASE